MNKSFVYVTIWSRKSLQFNIGIQSAVCCVNFPVIGFGKKSVCKGSYQSGLLSMCDKACTNTQIT